MKRTPLVRRTPLKTSPARPRPKRRPISPATREQRNKVRDCLCVSCGSLGPCDPAHLIDRSLCPSGGDDPRAVVPLCRFCHTAYDDHRLSLLEFLEPHYREEIAFAVERVGLVTAYKRLTADWNLEGLAA